MKQGNSRYLDGTCKSPLSGLSRAKGKGMCAQIRVVPEHAVLFIIHHSSFLLSLPSLPALVT